MPNFFIVAFSSNHPIIIDYIPLSSTLLSLTRRLPVNKTLIYIYTTFHQISNALPSLRSSLSTILSYSTLLPSTSIFNNLATCVTFLTPSFLLPHHAIFLTAFFIILSPRLTDLYSISGTAYLELHFARPPHHPLSTLKKPFIDLPNHTTLDSAAFRFFSVRAVHFSVKSVY